MNKYFVQNYIKTTSLVSKKKKKLSTSIVQSVKKIIITDTSSGIHWPEQPWFEKKINK